MEKGTGKGVCAWLDAGLVGGARGCGCWTIVELGIRLALSGAGIEEIAGLEERSLCSCVLKLGRSLCYFLLVEPRLCALGLL